MSYISPTQQSFDMHQYYPKCTKDTKCVQSELYSTISNHPDFKLYKKIMDLSGIANNLDDVTMFIPSDYYLSQKYPVNFFDNMDKNTALFLLRISTMNKQIDKNLLKKSVSSYYPTTDRSYKIHVTNYTETLLNHNVSVIHWNYKIGNNLVHVVDDLIR